jgi:hypothetical protein
MIRMTLTVYACLDQTRWWWWNSLFFFFFSFYCRLLLFFSVKRGIKKKKISIGNAEKLVSFPDRLTGMYGLNFDGCIKEFNRSLSMDEYRREITVMICKSSFLSIQSLILTNKKNRRIFPNKKSISMIDHLSFFHHRSHVQLSYTYVCAIAR